MTSPQFEHAISIKKFIQVLWVTVIVLLSIHILLSLVHYRLNELPWLLRQIFDVDEEASFPTWYSSIALFITSGVLWVNARAHRNVGSPLRWYWDVLAVGFLFLSIDEIAGIHETLNSEIDISWAIPGGIIAVLVGIAYIPFLFKLPRRTAVWFLIGGFIYIGGAVGVELYTEPYLVNDQLDTLAYYLWNAVEEGMEMGGVLIFLHALLLSMKGNSPSLPIAIQLKD